LPTRKFLTLDEVLAVHHDQISSFGGSYGVRDRGLLESALAQPRATFAGELLHPKIHQQATAYLYHLAMNHPFIDGNKRTAFAATDIFLRLNGYSLNLTNEQVYELVMQVACGQMGKLELANFLETVIAQMN